jgi:hypothetical protein
MLIRRRAGSWRRASTKRRGAELLPSLAVKSDPAITFDRLSRRSPSSGTKRFSFAFGGRFNMDQLQVSVDPARGQGGGLDELKSKETARSSRQYTHLWMPSRSFWADRANWFTFPASDSGVPFSCARSSSHLR